MSRRGNCYDNAMAENFFSILKTECIYRQKIRTFQQAKELIDDFIYFYNHEVENGRDAACATPLRLILNISYHGPFLCCPHNMGQFELLPVK